MCNLRPRLLFFKECFVFFFNPLLFFEGISWLGSRSEDGVVGPGAKTFLAHFMKVCKSKGATERGGGSRSHGLLFSCLVSYSVVVVFGGGGH